MRWAAELGYPEAWEVHIKAKMVSKPDTNIFFMSGLSQQQEEEVELENEGASSSKRKNHLEVKTIRRLRLSMIRWHASLPLTK